MALLTDYFAAADDETAKRTLEHGPAAMKLPTVNTTGLDPVVTMATLEQILTGAAAMTIINDSTDAVIAQGGKDGPWVATIRMELVRALGQPDASKLWEAAASWAMTEELSGANPHGLYEFLWNLAHLSKWAVENQQRVYCWMSL